MLKWLEENRIPMQTIHTSGHASVVDLKRFATAIGAKRLVPIHSFVPERFGDLFDNVERKRDGEWWGI